MTLAIHIGYHKTASTWLQRRVFVPQMGFAPLLDHQEIDQLILRPHDLDFDPAPAQATITVRQRSAPAKSCTILTSETLSGHPFFGGRQSATVAHRLHQIAPDAHIFICVRSQMSILPSVYMQYLQRGGTLSHAAFFAGPKGFGYPDFDPAHFCYDRLVSLYQSLFRNVHVLTFEQLTNAPDLVLANLSEKLGHTMPHLEAQDTQRVGASLPQALAPVVRRLNQTRVSTLNPAPAIALTREPGWMYRALGVAARSKAARSLLRHRPVSDYVAAHFATRFRDSNKRLAQITGGTLDLSGYP